MLIRSLPHLLERKRVPSGPVRANREHPLYPHCRGLWLWSGESAGVDLMGFTQLSFAGGATIGSHNDGACLLTNTGAGGGASGTFVSGDALYVTSGHGLSTFVRWAPTATAPDQYAAVAGIGYDSASNPYIAQQIFRNNLTDLFIGWNYGGSYSSIGVTASAADSTRSQVISHIFGTSVKAYSQGVEIASNTTNTAAPTYGTNPVVTIGRDAVTGRNSQAYIHITAFFACGLSQQDAQLLEEDPYSLVEPLRPHMYSPFVAPPTAAFRRRAMNGGLQNLYGLPQEIRKI